MFAFGRAGKEPLPDHLLAAEPFRLAIEAAPTGMILVDEQGRIGLVNTHVERLFGYSRDEAIGKPVGCLVPEMWDPVGHATLHGELEARRMDGARELYGRRKDGSELPIAIGLNPLRTPEGRFVLAS